MKSRLFLILFSIITLISTKLKALDNEKFTLVSSSNYFAYVYDEDQNKYLPYLKSQHGRSKSVTFKISKVFPPETKFLFQNKAKSIILINQKVLADLDKPLDFVLDIDSLLKNEVANISIVQEDFPLSLEDVAFVLENKQEVLNSAQYFNIIERQFSNKNNFVTTILFFIILLYILLKNIFPQTFKWYFDFTKIIKSTFLEESVYLNVFNRESLLLLLLNSITLGFVLTNFFFDNSSFQFIDYISQVFFFLIWVLFVLLLKFLLIKIVCEYLGVRFLTNKHVFEFNRTLTFVTIVLVPISLIFFMSTFSTLVVLYVVLFMFVLFLIRLVSIINKSTSFRNLYLFSYLCTTEIVPALFLVRYMINNVL